MNIIQEIQQNIAPNGQQNISGQVLQNTLVDMVTALSGGTGGSPGGVQGSIQTNSGNGGFYGDSGLTYNGTTVSLGTGQTINLDSSNANYQIYNDPNFYYDYEAILISGEATLVGVDIYTKSIGFHNGFSVVNYPYQYSVFEVTEQGSVWINDAIYDYSYTPSVDTNDRWLINTSGLLTVDWENQFLQGENTQPIQWANTIYPVNYNDILCKGYADSNYVNTGNTFINIYTG